MEAHTTEPLTKIAMWQVAFVPQYEPEHEQMIFAGYIFRNPDEHAERISIPDQAAATQLVTWLNEREELLAEH